MKNSEPFNFVDRASHQHSSQHENDANPDCVNPPNCLHLDDLRKRASWVHAAPTPKNNMPPIHVHINNTPLSDINGNDGSHCHIQNLKCYRSATPGSESLDSDAECLLVSKIVNQLHQKYPQLNFPQYLPILKEHSIVYTDSVADFPKDYYTDLGMVKGSVAPFLSGVKRALRQERKGKKQARMANKENAWIHAYEESVEI